ncbi:hypothetical protein GCM10010256_01850 [Streptomyces coeruleorubidus]|nr:hypothetical protein GCM10010256_01850 [Streptomyces coeruleorubidus]
MLLSRLLDYFETAVSPSYCTFGLVDTSVDTYSPYADRTNWLLSAPGMVYLQVPQQVIRASVRLESWSTVPPANDAQWSGAEDVEVELPGGELALETIDGGQKEVPLILPSPGLYRMRWQSIFRINTAWCRSGAQPPVKRLSKRRSRRGAGPPPGGW